MPIDVIRDGTSLGLQTTIADRETWLAQAESQPQLEEERAEVVLGMEVSGYTAEIARDIGAEHVGGLYVWSVYPGSPADRAGITAGSIVMKVGGAEVVTIEQLVTSIRDEGSKTRIPLIVQEPDGAIARKIIRR